jgi:hypothetical protein
MPPVERAGPDELSWHADESRAVIAAAHAFVVRHAASAEQRSLLTDALAELRAAAPGPTPAPHLALLVHGAESGDHVAARPLGLAAALAELGMDLIDQLTDAEPGRRWREPRGDRRLIAAVSLLASAPLALDELVVPEPRRDMVRRRFLADLFPVAAGQQADLELRRTPAPDPEAVRASVAGKTGARRAHYARLGALAAGASEKRSEGWARFGHHLGVTAQLASDAADAVAGDESRDLASGAPTLPIALWLGSLPQPERDAAIDLLRRARRDSAARHEVREGLRATGATRFCLVVAAGEAAAARRTLEELAPPAPWGDRLRRWVASLLA